MRTDQDFVWRAEAQEAPRFTIGLAFFIVLIMGLAIFSVRAFVSFVTPVHRPHAVGVPTAESTATAPDPSLKMPDLSLKILNSDHKVGAGKDTAAAVVADAPPANESSSDPPNADRKPRAGALSTEPAPAQQESANYKALREFLFSE